MKSHLEDSYESSSDESFEMPTKEQTTELFKQLNDSEESAIIGQFYLIALSNAVESDSSETIRLLDSITIDENFSKVQDAALAMILIQAIQERDIEAIKLFKSAGVKLDFLFNEIDFSVLKLEDQNILEGLEKLTSPKIKINLLALAARAFANFEYATGTADISMVKCLFENGVKSVSAEEIYPALLAGNFELVKYMVSEVGIDPNSPVEANFAQEKMALLMATVWQQVETGMSFPIHKGHLDIMNFLCDKGADVNAVFSDKFHSDLTALKMVAMAGSVEQAQCLVNHGANIHGDDFATPLYYAIRNHRFYLVRFLIEKGADFTLRIPYKQFAKPINSAPGTAVSQTVRGLLEAFDPERVKEIDNKKSSISFFDLAELEYKYDLDLLKASSETFECAEICIYLYFLQAVAELKNNNTKNATKALVTAVRYQQELIRMKHPSNLLFRLANLLSSEEPDIYSPEDEIYYLKEEQINFLNKFLSSCKQSYLNEIEKLGIGLKEKETESLRNAIIFEDTDQIKQFFDNHTNDENSHKHRFWAFSVNVELESLHHYYFEALSLALKLESVNVTRELNRIGKTFPEGVQKAIHAVVLVRSLLGSTANGAKILHKAGIDPNIQFKDLDFSIFKNSEKITKKKMCVKIEDAVNVVDFLGNRLHTSTYKIPHPALGYLLRHGFRPESNANAPNSPSLGSSRNTFMPSPRGDNQNNNNLDDYEKSSSEINAV